MISASSSSVCGLSRTSCANRSLIRLTASPLRVRLASARSLLSSVRSLHLTGLQICDRSRKHLDLRNAILLISRSTHPVDVFNSGWLAKRRLHGANGARRLRVGMHTRQPRRAVTKVADDLAHQLCVDVFDTTLAARNQPIANKLR